MALNIITLQLQQICIQAKPMSMFAISYDLKESTKDYASFFNEVRSLGNATQVLSNMFIVDFDTPSGTGNEVNTSDIYNRLKPELGLSDHILICQVTPSELSGFLSSDSVDWIKEARERINQ